MRITRWLTVLKMEKLLTLLVSRHKKRKVKLKSTVLSLIIFMSSVLSPTFCDPNYDENVKNEEFRSSNLYSSSPVHSSHLTNIITTKYGSLRGLKLHFSSSSTKNLDPVSVYLGIPYASPPINAYRFMPPVAPLPWGSSVKLATKPPPPCPQKFPNLTNRTLALTQITNQRLEFLERLVPLLANQSEDCLYLNFYVPSLPQGEELRSGKFPILFVIHGESWEWGSGNEFDGGILASLGYHIVVTFNYRLGILGFLKTSNQQSNFGLLDVIAALHYVRENCASFGGDRNRITLLGYKTGAVIANLLLIAQIAKDLFHRAILISGSVLSPWALQRRPEEIALQVSLYLGCKGRLPLSHPESDLAPCLRKKHLSELLSFSPISPRFLSPFAPYVDNILIKSPKDMMEGGTQNYGREMSAQSPSDQFTKSPLLLAFTTSESSSELSELDLRHGFEIEHRDKLLRTLVRNVYNFHQAEIFSIVRNEYTDWERPVAHPIPLRDSTLEALSDGLGLGPLVQVANLHARGRGARTYLLHFSHVRREIEGTVLERLGSLEGEIVPYLMGLPITNNVPVLGSHELANSSPWAPVGNYTKQDALISDSLIHYISNFVHSGDPNTNEVSDWSSSSRSRPRFLHWEPYEETSQVHLNFNLKPKLKNHYRGHKLALWLNLIPQIHLQGGTEVLAPHHAFPDDSPSLYIGPVRQLFPLSYGDQIPGVGTSSNFNLNPKGLTTSVPLNNFYPPTTECVKSSTDSFSHGVVEGDDDESSVRINGLETRGSNLVSNSSADYDYTTALTVTLTVGVCLIFLNILVFSAIMCHRKRTLPGTMSPPAHSSPIPSAAHNSNLNLTSFSSYHNNQEDFKWMNSNCSSAHHLQMDSSNDPYANISHHHQDNSEELVEVSDGNCRRGNCMAKNLGNTGNFGNFSEPSYFCSSEIPNEFEKYPVVPPPPGHFSLTMDEESDFEAAGESMRLFMNQPEGGSYQTVSNFPLSPHISSKNISAPNCSSPNLGNNLANNLGTNQSPSNSTTTLVSALKRNSNTGTVKKRVQIQEISV